MREAAALYDMQIVEEQPRPHLYIVPEPDSIERPYTSYDAIQAFSARMRILEYQAWRSEQSLFSCSHCCARLPKPLLVSEEGMVELNDRLLYDQFGSVEKASPTLELQVRSTLQIKEL